MIGRRSLLLAGAAIPTAAYGQCVTDRFTVDACLGGVRGASGPPGMTLDLNFMFPGSLDPRITFTRASTALYLDSTGTMQTAAVNQPRWDYANGTLNGLLLEPVATNLSFPSVPDAGALWAQAGSISKGGSVIAPDNTTSTTSLFASTDTTNSSRSFGGPGGGVTATTTYTVSVFLRKGPNNAYIQVNIVGSVTAVPIAYYDLTNGTSVVGADLIAGATGLSASITPYPNGWYRARFTFTTNAGATSVGPYIGPCVTVSATGDNRAYAGVVGQGVYVWGLQLEQGAVATSYISTTSTAVTRAPDNCRVPSANMTPWYVSPGGSWLIEFIQSSPSVNTRLIGVGGGGGGQTPAFSGSGTNAFSQFDGVTLLGTVNGIVPGAVRKGASTYAPSTGKVCLNAGAVASVAMAAGYASLAANGVRFFADEVGNSPTTGYLRRVTYWPRVLSDAEMQQVTT